MKCASFDIVFQEVPGEVTLALNLTQCPCHCKGCHSQHLSEDIGEVVTAEWLKALIDGYSMVTCVGFMGGDAYPSEVDSMAQVVREWGYKVAWYSGRNEVSKEVDIAHFDYIKVGPYKEELGGLKSPATNQRFYKIEDGEMVDKTCLFTQRH